MATSTSRRRVDIPTAPAIRGLGFRHWSGESDLAGMFAANQLARRADGELEPPTLDGMANYYRHLDHCDLDEDLLVVEIDDRIVGYARVEWTDSNDGERWYECTAALEPAVRRHGIGTAMLAWSETRRAEIRTGLARAGNAPEVPTYLTTYVNDGDVGAHELLRGAGYEPMRRFHEMVRRGLSEVPQIPLPHGLRVRAVGTDRAALRQLYDAAVEAFRDHFGWAGGTDADFESFVEDPDGDASLWVVAFDGDEVAGGVTNIIHGEGDTRQGWLDSVFTRRPWRRRGLARALIARSLVLLRERGLDSAYLGVDATNPNQALDLYESLGFEVASSATAYRKPIGEPEAVR